MAAQLITLGSAQRVYLLFRAESLVAGQACRGVKVFRSPPATLHLRTSPSGTLLGDPAAGILGRPEGTSTTGRTDHLRFASHIPYSAPLREFAGRVLRDTLPRTGPLTCGALTQGSACGTAV